MTFANTASRLSIALLVLGLCVATTLALPLSKQDGDRLQGKIEEIAKNGSTVPLRARRTPVSENEVNSYLAFNAKDNVPRGLTDPQINIVGDGALAGRALVDLDEFKRHRNSQGFMDPLNYLSGKVPITARGILRTRDGKGQFQLGSATILGVPLPKPLLQELVTFFTRTPESPKGFNLDAPFDLPAKIREVAINRGEAVVVQ